MPSITGGDQLDPEYSPQFYIGPNAEHFVWQTRVEMEHAGFLFRAGRVESERRVADKAALRYRRYGRIPSKHFELIRVSELPKGFPEVPSFSGKVNETSKLIRQIQPESDGILEEQLDNH